MLYAMSRELVVAADAATIAEVAAHHVSRSLQASALVVLADAEGKVPTPPVDLSNRVTRGPGGEEAHLTPLEHRILECLARHAESVVTHTQVMKEVWGPHQIDIRSLRVYGASWRST